MDLPEDDFRRTDPLAAIYYAGGLHAADAVTLRAAFWALYTEGVEVSWDKTSDENRFECMQARLGKDYGREMQAPLWEDVEYDEEVQRCRRAMRARVREMGVRILVEEYVRECMDLEEECVDEARECERRYYERLYYQCHGVAFHEYSDYDF